MTLHIKKKQIARLIVLFTISNTLQTIRFIQMMSLTFGLFTQVSESKPYDPLVYELQQPEAAVMTVSLSVEIITTHGHSYD